MFEGIGKILTTVGSVLGVTSLDDAVKKLKNGEYTPEQQLQLESVLNQDASNTRDREIQMAKVNPEGNWPMYTMAYIACGIWVVLNIGLFFNTVLMGLAVDIVSFDKYCIAGIGAYFFASRFFRGDR